MAKILVADDDAYIVRVLTMWLTRHGHDVYTAANGDAALTTLAQLDVDLIISDMNMPLLDGVGLARAVRERFNRDTPMLVLTARCDQEQLTQRLAEWDVRVYPKPFLPSQLVIEINRLLSARLPLDSGGPAVAQ
jgi:CheY-like chemotaxis protein